MIDEDNGMVLLNVASLRAQVYEYLRREISNRKILPGDIINIGEMSQQLGISKTPLRDALIQLDTEGFVRILPRRGVVVNGMTLHDVKDAYEVVGTLEAQVIRSNFDKFTPDHVKEMDRLNNDMRKVIQKGDFETHYRLNLAFHNVYLSLSENRMLQNLVMPIKQRLFDFPKREYNKEWELSKCNEHQRLYELIAAGERDEASRFVRDTHWSFANHEKYIREFHIFTAA